MNNCEICQRKNLWQSSQWWEGGRRYWQCRNCTHWQLEVPPQGLKVPPKILYLDVETALMKVDVFSTFIPGKYISWKAIDKRSYVICWAACWITDKPIKVISDSVTSREARRGSDKRCLQRLFELMDESDYLVGHNARAFDIKKLNTRFLHNKMGAPLESKVIDTLALARKHFKEDSNSLEAWSLLLGGTAKDDMRMEDWQKICNNGDAASLRKMVKYCRGDIRNGVHVYKEFERWIASSGKRLYR